MQGGENNWKWLQMVDNGWKRQKWLKTVERGVGEGIKATIPSETDQRKKTLKNNTVGGDII